MILCLGTRGDAKTRDGSTQLLEQILGIFMQAYGMPFLCALFGAAGDNEMHVVSKIMQKTILELKPLLLKTLYDWVPLRVIVFLFLTCFNFLFLFPFPDLSVSFVYLL